MSPASLIDLCYNALSADGDPTNEVRAVGDIIRGYTAHGLEQAMERDGGRGVNPGAMLNAVKNPNEVLYEIDKLGRESIKYIGEKATVVLNNAGEIISTWGQPRNLNP